MSYNFHASLIKLYHYYIKVYTLLCLASGPLPASLLLSYFCIKNFFDSPPTFKNLVFFKSQTNQIAVHTLICTVAQRFPTSHSTLLLLLKVSLYQYFFLLPGENIDKKANDKRCSQSILSKSSCEQPTQQHTAYIRNS